VNEPKTAQDMQKYTFIRPVVMEGYPDAHNVFLKITNQTFRIDTHACETKEEAEWLQTQLCVALAKMVNEATPHRE
jgi:hypothetical protein